MKVHREQSLQHHRCILLSVSRGLHAQEIDEHRKERDDMEEGSFEVEKKSVRRRDKMVGHSRRPFLLYEHPSIRFSEGTVRAKSATIPSKTTPMVLFSPIKPMERKGSSRKTPPSLRLADKSDDFDWFGGWGRVSYCINTCEHACFKGRVGFIVHLHTSRRQKYNTTFRILYIRGRILYVATFSSF